MTAPPVFGRSVLDMVCDFHRAFDCPISSVAGVLLDPEEQRLRIALLREEFEEYLDAIEANDVVGIADALGDMVYVIYGTALAHGIDLDAVVTEIHRSNMSKAMPDGSVLRREDGKVLKGPDYFAPRIRHVLGWDPA